MIERHVSNRWLTRAGIILLAAIVLFATRPAAADRERIGPLDVEPQGDLTQNAKVNPLSQRRYTGANWKAEKNQMIEVHVWSEEFMPEVLVFTADHNGHAVGTHLRKSEPEQYVHPETGKTVYYCSLQFAAPADGNYRIIYTHLGKDIGKFTTEGSIWSKPTDTGSQPAGDLWPELPGYTSKNYGDPTAGPSQRGTNLVGAEYNLGGRRAFELHGCLVKPGAAVVPDWDRQAKPGGAYDPSKVARESMRGNELHREWQSGGKNIIVVSPSRMTYVEVVIFPEFRDQEALYIHAARSMLAELESHAASRPSPGGSGTFGSGRN